MFTSFGVRVTPGSRFKSVRIVPVSIPHPHLRPEPHQGPWRGSGGVLRNRPQCVHTPSASMARGGRGSGSGWLPRKAPITCVSGSRLPSEAKDGDSLDPRGGLLSAVLERLEHTETDGLDTSSIPTGLADLDRKLGGLLTTTLVVVTCRPGDGQDALAMSIASHVAVNQGPFAYFSLEMSPTESRLRMAGRRSQSRLHAPAHRPNQRWWGRGCHDTDLGKTGPRHQPPLPSPPTRRRRPPHHRRHPREESAPQTPSGPRPAGRSRLRAAHAHPRRQPGEPPTRIAEISRNLKALACELDVPVVAVSQLNRALETHNDKRPQLGDIRESGAIKQPADLVLMTYRDDYYNPDSPKQDIAKQRAGPTRVIKATFTDKYTRFDNLPHRYTNTLGQ